MDYKTREDFSSDNDYAEYVRDNIKTGMFVLCGEAFDEVEVGDYGNVIKLDEEDPDGLNVLIDWINLKDTYWSKYEHLVLVGFYDPEEIEYGDWVKVKHNVVEPMFMWGDVDRHSIGVVTAMLDDKSALIADFPEQAGWRGALVEMEKIPKLHPSVQCDGCDDIPLEGCRYVCTECDDFDLCEDCFKTNTDHEHNFKRIISPGATPGYAGPPGSLISVGDYVRVKAAEHVLEADEEGPRCIGKVTALSVEEDKIKVDFKDSAGCERHLSEMEKVDVVHVYVECDGCDLQPIGGVRYKCSKCDDFDYCEDCFNTKTNHNHEFVQITAPGKSPSPAGVPPEADEFEDESSDEGSEDSSEDDLETMFKVMQFVTIGEDPKAADSNKYGRQNAGRRSAAASRVRAAAANTGNEGTCKYLDLCRRFKDTLELDDTLFEVSHDKCFCKSCHDKRGDKLYYTRGEPPKDYGLPIGWCKFGLSPPPRAQTLNVFKIWHIAFHGTRPECIKPILHTGDLLMPGDVTPGGFQLSIPSTHFDPTVRGMEPPPGHDVKKIYLSPSINYSGCDVYAPAESFEDPETSNRYGVRVALQVRIQPGTYQEGKETIGARWQLDQRFPNSVLEWSTKARGVVILTGVLVKIEGYSDDRSACPQLFSQQQ